MQPGKSILRRFAPLSLRVRLVIGYAGVLLLIVLLGFLTALEIRQNALANQEFQIASQYAMDVQDLSQSNMLLLRTIDEGLISQDAEAFRKNVPVALKTVEQKHLDFQHRYQEVTSISSAVARISGVVKPMVAQAQVNAWTQIAVNRESLQKEIQAVIDEIGNAQQRAEVSRQQAIQRNQQTLAAVIRNLIAIFLAAGGLSIFMILSTVRSVVIPIQKMMASANRMAGGFLDEQVEISSSDEVGQLGASFNEMGSQLKSLYSGMENLIAVRTAELQYLTEQMRAATEVAHAATTILDPQELEELVVERICERFNFYHAGIFLLDETGTWAVLHAASSEGGKRMLARQHKLQVGQGVVGTAIQTREAHVAQDVGADAVYFNNPDLPSTHSEVALPLRARGRILGALDVQSLEVAAFNRESVDILQTLADQVALSLDNARLFQESQSRLAEVRRLYGAYSRQAWEKAVRGRRRSGYRYTPIDGVKEVGAFTTASEKAAPVSAGQTGSGNGNGAAPIGERALTAPVTVRSTVIGKLTARKADGQGEWTPDEVALVNNLVEQLAAAMESARLFDETQRRAEREHLASAITAKVRASNDPQVILQTAVRELREALQAQRAQVTLQPDQDGA
jgi:GAF domain-containing protein